MDMLTQSQTLGKYYKFSRIFIKNDRSVEVLDGRELTKTSKKVVEERLSSTVKFQEIQTTEGPS